MRNKARDGSLFNSTEQSAYVQGFRIGHYRRENGEFMGSAHTSGFRGRNRLIFNEGLEDGYSGVGWSTNDGGEPTCFQIGNWHVNDFAQWQGYGVRITSLWPPGTFGNNTVSLASISNMNQPFCGGICETVNLSDLSEHTSKSK